MTVDRDIKTQLTAKVNSQPRKILFRSSFHVKQETRSYFTDRFLEAWHRLDVKTGRRVKQLHLAEMLADRLGASLSPNTVKGWEKGAIPDVESIAAIADLCGVHPAWLAYGLGTPDDPVVGVVSVRPKQPKKAEAPVFIPAPPGKRMPTTKKVAPAPTRRKGSA